MAKTLEQEDKEEEVKLRKAPNLLLKSDACETDDAPVKTLEELKAENFTHQTCISSKIELVTQSRSIC